MQQKTVCVILHCMLAFFLVKNGSMPVFAFSSTHPSLTEFKTDNAETEQKIILDIFSHLNIGQNRDLHDADLSATPSEDITTVIAAE